MQHDIPHVARLSTRLAADNLRVMRSVDRMAQRVDALIDALRRGDMSELRRLSENLVTTSNADGADTLRYRAERVCQELHKPNNLRAIKRSVVHLIGACGSLRRTDHGQGQGHGQGQLEDWQI
jgi:hypothetical protein